MSHADRPIRTADPTVLSARKGPDGDQLHEDFPDGEYHTVRFETPEGPLCSATVGDELRTGDTLHGTVARIVHHTDTHATVNREAWRWTVYFDYTSGSEGGVPLGELATQLTEGASLDATAEGGEC